MRRIILALAVALGLIAGLPAPASAVTTITCEPATMLQPSATYGVIGHFGAECAHSIDVEVKGKLFRNGVLIETRTVKCVDTEHNEMCQGFVFASNPAGQQKFKIVAKVTWELHDQGDYPKFVSSSSTGWF